MNDIMKILDRYPGLEVDAAKRLIEKLASSDKDVLRYITNSATMPKNLQTKYGISS